MGKFTNHNLVSFLLALQAKGSPYWYGTVVYECTESRLKSKAKQYPSHYTDSRIPKYRQNIADKAICADCIGSIKGFMWTNGGEGVLESYGTGKDFANKYGSNNCPDKSANGMFEYAKKQGMPWGTIDTIPEIPGIAVRYDGHVGTYIGNGKVVEWRGFNYGSQITELKDRKWLHWYQLPFIEYVEAEKPEEPEKEVQLGERVLKLTDPAMHGADVTMLQELLAQLGYEVNVDGVYGNKTAAEVVRFQKDNFLTADGIYGADTHAALMDAVADNDAGNPGEDIPTPPETPVEPPVEPVVKMVEVVSKGGNVNVRSGNGTEYNRVSSVKPGTKFEFVATAVNGWHAVKIGGKIGWVSGDYSKLV